MNFARHFMIKKQRDDVNPFYPCVFSKIDINPMRYRMTIELHNSWEDWHTIMDLSGGFKKVTRYKNWNLIIRELM